MKNIIDNTFTNDQAIDAFALQNNRMTKPLKTDFKFLQWLDEGRLIILGGGSGLGKTAFVLQMIYNLVKENQKSDNDNDNIIGIYASSEMMIEELTMRLIVNQQALECDMSDVRKKFNNRIQKPETFEENIKKAKQILGNIPFYFINASQFNINNIIDTIKIARKKNPNKRIFVAIDYLQLFLLSAEGLQEQNRLILSLKNALVEYKANAIVISALNRDSLRNDFVDMSAFKDSSMIEYTADIGMLFAFKKDNGRYTLKKSEEVINNNEIEIFLKCVKNRLGSEFSHKMVFNKKKQSFKIKKDSDIVVEDKEDEKSTRKKKPSVWDII